MTMKNDDIKKTGAYKNWLTVGLVAAALTLSACGKKDEAPMETEAPADAQTAVENDASSVATAGDDVAVASANDGMAVDANDDVAVATADDKEVLDGTEKSESVSTY